MRPDLTVPLSFTTRPRLAYPWSGPCYTSMWMGEMSHRSSRAGRLERGSVRDQLNLKKLATIEPATVTVRVALRTRHSETPVWKNSRPFSQCAPDLRVACTFLHVRTNEGPCRMRMWRENSLQNGRLGVSRRPARGSGVIKAGPRQLRYNVTPISGGADIAEFVYEASEATNLRELSRIRAVHAITAHRPTVCWEAKCVRKMNSGTGRP